MVLVWLLVLALLGAGAVSCGSGVPDRDTASVGTTGLDASAGAASGSTTPTTPGGTAHDTAVPGATAPPGASPPDGSAAPPGPTDPPPGGATRSWAVATTTRSFVDPTRQRTLQTTIYYPSGARPAARTPGALPAEAAASAPPAPGAFPLVLMAHGYLLPGDGYDRMMKTVAAAGYVVAAPEFPHNTGHGGDGLRSDIVNQPRDLSFVADQVIGLGGAPGPPTPRIDTPDRLAVVGHSDGGLTATAMAYGHQFRDRRVVAAVSLTGGIALFPGAYFAPDSPPLLAAHARDDSTNPYSASVNLFNQVPPGRARFLLSIDAGSHIDPYMFATGRVDLGEAIAAFLDLTMRGDAAAADRLRAIAVGPGLSLQEAG